MYHAKIMPDGNYIFRVHDCIGGVRLRGDLNNPHEAAEAAPKLRALAMAALEFAEYIENRNSVDL